MRAFIGILIPENLKKKIEEIQEKIKKMPLKAKFVERENLHISLSFLGEIPDENLEFYKKELDKISRSFKKFKVDIGKIKFIPSENYIRVIAFEAIGEDLDKLRKIIVNNIGGDSKPAHITLCRIKSISEKNKIISELSEIKLNESFIVEKINLIKSELKKNGPIYMTIHESFLT